MVVTPSSFTSLGHHQPQPSEDENDYLTSNFGFFALGCKSLLATTNPSIQSLLPQWSGPWSQISVDNLLVMTHCFCFLVTGVGKSTKVGRHWWWKTNRGITGLLLIERKKCCLISNISNTNLLQRQWTIAFKGNPSQPFFCNCTERSVCSELFSLKTSKQNSPVRWTYRFFLCCLGNPRLPHFSWLLFSTVSNSRRSKMGNANMIL